MPDQANKAAQVNETPKKREKDKPANPGQVGMTEDFVDLSSILQRGDLDLAHLTLPAVLALRGVVGNQVISRWVERQNAVGDQLIQPKDDMEDVASTAGGLELVTTPEANPVSEAPTAEEAEADVNRPGAATVGNVLGAAAAALTGISISSTTNAGPVWRNRGAF